MAILDRVFSQSIISGGNDSGGFTTPPLVGTLLSAASPTAIQWENGRNTSQLVDNLLKVLDPDPDAAQLVGQWLQVRSLPLVAPGVDGGTPKSPGASGVCVRAIGFGDIGSTVLAGTILVVSLANGVLIAGSYIADDPGSGIFGAFAANLSRREI